MLMGTMFQVSVAGVEEQAARAAISAALDAVAEVEARLSPHRDTSEVSRLNAAAGGDPVPISAETVEVLQLARQISERSEGAFDVTFAALSPVWRSLRATPPTLPSDEAVAAARALVDYRQLVVDARARTASLQRPSMRLDLGGIGKGHGIDRAGAVLEARGIQNYIVGGGGDLLVRGSKQGTPWRLGIQHPRRRGGLIGTLVFTRDQAVVTSGDYERFVEIDGRRYHHILDPRTGHPVSHTVSVTLTAPNATLADALSTAVFVLGPRAGMALVERTDDVEALIIDAEMNITMSPGMRETLTMLDDR
jgi:FAD:protein FMN transferase